MAEFEIDRAQAERMAQLIREVLQNEVPDGDWTAGGPLSELIVEGPAIIVGWLQQQIRNAANKQSLRTLQNLPESESVRDAADAILDNFLVTRNQGAFAKGTATLHFSQRVDALIPRNTRFFKTSSLVYFVESNTDVFIPSSQLRANIDATGQVLDWITTVYLTAARVGADYNADPGRFVALDRFSPYLLFAENLQRFSDGAGLQTTSDFISRSLDAISLRALINARSNNVVLLQNFQSVQSVLTIGNGDPEMSRDLVGNVANVADIHVGGHMDIYVRQTVQQAVDTFVIGELQTRNDGVVTYFRDSAATFLSDGVAPGRTLMIGEGIPEAPFSYVIEAVNSETELQIARRVPFSVATDALGTATEFSYSIGYNYPEFDNLVSASNVLTANTSDRFSILNTVQLDAQPAYRIRKVELVNPPSSLNGYLDPVSGTVLFKTRSNTPVTAVPPQGSELAYSVRVDNPQLAQSDKAVTLLTVAWPTVDLSGYTLEVTYDTQLNFQEVTNYVDDRFNRPGAANTVVKALHPVYVFASIGYRLRQTAVNTLTPLAVFDAQDAENTLQTFVNGYTSGEPLDASLLATQARLTSSAIANIYPFVVSYELILADGRVMTFTTSDLITVFPDGTTSTAALVNPTGFGLPATEYYADLVKLLTAQGISNRTLRYLAEDGAITLTPR